MLEVDQISLISTAEIHLRKLFLHLLHFPCCFIFSQYGMKYQSMSLTFNIINICNIDSDHTAFHIHHDNLRFPLFHPADSTVKPLGKCEIRHRLQYIIQRIHCISSDRILCHIRNENDHNLRVNFTDFFSCRHSVHEFHFHIHQNNIVLGFIFIYNLIAV